MAFPPEYPRAGGLSIQPSNRRLTTNPGNGDNGSNPTLPKTIKGLEYGALEISRIPYSNSSNSLVQDAKKRGFVFSSQSLRPIGRHPDGSWICADRVPQRGVDRETIDFIPPDLSSLDVLPPTQVTTASSIVPQWTPTLTAELKKSGFTEVKRGFFVHADASWVAVFHDQTVIRGLNDKQLDPTDIITIKRTPPRTPPKKKPTKTTADKAPKKTADKTPKEKGDKAPKTADKTKAAPKAGTPVKTVGSDGLLCVTSPADAEDVALAEELLGMLPRVLKSALRSAGYTINIARHSVTNADPRLAGRATTGPQPVLLDQAEGLHRAGGTARPWIGVRTYRVDGKLRLDARTLLHEIGHAVDLVLAANRQGPLHLQKAFVDAFKEEHTKLPAYFHTQEEFFADCFARYMLDPKRLQRELPKMYAALDAHISKSFDQFVKNFLTTDLAAFTRRQHAEPVVNIVGGDNLIDRLDFIMKANAKRADAGMPPQPAIFTIKGKLDFGAFPLAQHMQHKLTEGALAGFEPTEGVVHLKAAQFNDPTEMAKVLDAQANSQRPAILFVDDLAAMTAAAPGLAVLQKHLDRYGHLNPLVLAGSANGLLDTEALLAKVVRYDYALDPLTPKQQVELVVRYAADENFNATRPAIKALQARAKGGDYQGTFSLWQSLKKAQVERISTSASDQDLNQINAITKMDVDAMDLGSTADPATKLARLIGQKPAKEQVASIVGTAKVAAMREAHGLPVGPRPRMNLLFAGPPGTGKTTVAEAFIELLVDVGYLKSPSLTKLTIQDLVGAGSPEQAVKQLFENNKGGAIFIDEMHQLMDTPEGKRAFKAMIPYLGSEEYADTVFIGAGYDAEMMDLIRSVDPGAERRFVKVPFESFSKAQLDQILDLMASDRNVTLTPEAKKAALSYVDYRKRTTKNFGNAGEVQLALDHATKRQTARLATMDPAKVTKNDLTAFVPEDFAIPQRITPDEFWAELDALDGWEDVKAKFREMADLVEFAKSRGKSPCDAVEPYHILEGPPGVGKTTLARLLARFGEAYGMIPQGEVVEKLGAGLQGRYSGQTTGDVSKIFEDAHGRFLFVDEVSGLAKAGGGFKDETATVILKQTEDNRGRFMMAVADYPENINLFLDLNPGLARRFANRWTLKAWTAEQATAAFTRRLADMDLDAGALGDAVVQGFGKLAGMEGWASGGDVRTLAGFTEKHLASALMSSAPGVEITALLPQAFTGAVAELEAQKKAGAGPKTALRVDGAAHEDAAQSVVETKAEPHQETFDNNDRKLMAAMEAVDKDFAAHFDALGPEALIAAQADPKSDYMKAVAEAAGVKPAEAVKQADAVRVKIQRLVEREEVTEHFKYHCPYCGGIDSGSCAYMSMPMDWKVQHSLKKPWTEVKVTTELVTEEI